MQKIIVILLSTVLLLCTNNGNLSNSESTISISGKIFNNNNDGISNIEVSLSKFGISANTDINGCYEIFISEKEIQQYRTTAESNLIDTLVYKFNNSSFFSSIITVKDTTIPDMFLIQRNMSGYLLKNLDTINKIECEITFKSDSLQTAKYIPLWYNRTNSQYSGFFYIVENLNINNFTANINVYAFDSLRLTGKSESVNFNSIAGNITFPKFDPLNAMPKPIAGNDTTVVINDTVYFIGNVTNLFGGINEMYKWDFNGDMIFEDSSFTSLSSHHIFTHADKYNVIFYVRDSDGFEATDTLVVNVNNNAPSAQIISTDTMITINDSVQLLASAYDADGNIVNYSWDYNGDGTFDFSDSISPNTSYKFINPGIYNVVFKATDDDNKFSTDTLKVTVLLDIPVAYAGKDTLVTINDTVQLKGLGYDSIGGNIDKWEWSFNGSNFIECSKSDTNIIAPNNLPPYYHYLCILRVTDNDNLTDIDTVNITILEDRPIFDLGNDTFVCKDSLITIKPKTFYDKYGFITKVKWDLDYNGTWDIIDTVNPTGILEHRFPNSTKILASITDDDNNEVLTPFELHHATYLKVEV